MTANPVEKKFGRQTVLYVVISVLLLGAPSLLQLADPGQADAFFYLAEACAFFLGFAHVYLLYRLVPSIPRASFGKGLLFTLLLVVAGILAGAVAYYFLSLDYRFLTYPVAFLLPWFCYQVYVLFRKIPARDYKVWYYPLDEAMPDLDMIDLSQIQVVQFVFPKTPEDATQTNFTSKAPLNMTLGQLFFIFINDYNAKNVQSPIAYLARSGQPYGWFFYRKQTGLAKPFYFDADLSFRDNRIATNEFIYAERVG